MDDEKIADQQKKEIDKTQLQIIDEKMAKLKARRQAIVNREKEKERKDRTRRLIQMGALAEKYLDIHSVEELEKRLKEYKNRP